ncbi:MAG: peptidylprolyl isomerase [Saprospiraceae bacterium]|nr:peptidylprolyl isomerase [Saprospiraceae bacterium]
MHTKATFLYYTPFYWLIAICLVVTCRPSSGELEQAVVLTEVNLRLDDSVSRKIFNLQDMQRVDSLVPFLNDPDPTYRYLAANAFASMGIAQYTDTLASLLRDPIEKVRQVAAYAMGQIGDENASPQLISAFQNSGVDPNNELNGTLLEAVGKCAPAHILPLVSSVRTYLDSDHHLLLGQARSIYQFMLRGITDTTGTRTMLDLLSKQTIDQRIHVVAANYLQRTTAELSEYVNELMTVYKLHREVPVRMFLAIALGKTKRAAGISELRTSYAEESDYRVRANIVRAMAQNPYDLVRRDIHKALYDAHLQVAVTAADIMIEQGSGRHWKEYMNLSLGTFPWLVKIKLLHATNKFIPAGNTMFRNINEEILRQKIRSPINDYEQAAALEALGENQGRYREVLSHLDSDISYIGKTACVRAIINISSKPTFNTLGQAARQEIIESMVKAITSGDAGQVEVASKLFALDQIKLADYGQDPTNIIREGLRNLQLPRDVEAYQALDNALQTVTGQQQTAAKHLYTHPIEWTALSMITDSSLINIATSKGDILVGLFPIAAPGTVANFIDLVRMNYYADKFIHRVVPNFVIQGGCNRGDGYGSLDYTIRSELPQQYYDEEGYLGMASAGNHTESAQWFITHCPTPHLDGNYTIFGKVVNGMSVVHAMEIGDKINSITIR